MLKRVVSLLVCGIVFALHVSCSSSAPADEASSVLRINPEAGTALARGVVVSNNRDCILDGLCSLILAAGKGQVMVIYHEGEGGTCLNIEAIRAGGKAGPGNYLEIFGAYHDENGGPWMSTCPKLEFYIRRIEADS